MHRRPALGAIERVSRHPVPAGHLGQQPSETPYPWSWGVAVFRVAFERWSDGSDGRPLSAVISESADELRAVTAEG